MVDEQKYLPQFQNLGIKKLSKNKDGVLLVDIPANKISEFVSLSLESMEPGRWNEYVGPTIGFFFKYLDGKTEHIVLGNDNENEIKEKLRIFVPNWPDNQSIKEWLTGVDIYSDIETK